jgi:TRAP-type C4-dicarboxylate transport system substrate-binding protein
MHVTRLACGLASLVLLGAAQPASAGQTLKLMHFFPASQLTSQTDSAYAAEVAKKTNGNLKITIFWAGALGKAAEVLDLVGGGAVAMGATLPNYFPAQLPFSSLGAVPLGYFSNAKTALSIERTIVDHDAAAIAELKKANLVPLLIHGLFPYHLICTKPIARVADLAGTKIRTFGAYAPSAIKAFGAVPVNLQPAEIYEGLQHGTVECVMDNYDFAASSKLYEVAKFWSTISFGSFAGYQVYINRKVYEGLPKDQAKVLRDAGLAAEQAELAKLKQAEDDAIAKAKKAGVKFVAFEEQAAFDKKLPDTLDAWAKQTVAAGVPKADVDRVVKLIHAKTGK